MTHQEFLEKFGDIAEQQSSHKIPVSILDSESRVISSGQGLLDTRQCVGVFFPSGEVSLDIPDRAKKLTHGNKQILTLTWFEKCAESLSPHYHFAFSSDV